MKNSILITLLIISVYSCKVTHNIPGNQTPNEIISENSYKVFVDQNGDFYPDDWKKKYGDHPKNAASKFGAYSLNKIALDKKISKNLNLFRNKTIKEIRGKFNNSKRLFIFIHGYNNDEAKAKIGFDLIQDKIEFQPTDGIIQFYWDGLFAKGPIGSVGIWNNAAGYSQLAGERALRPILNLFFNKDIVLISHSRGGSVLLSGLSDPPYSHKFAKDTYDFHKIKIHNEPKLAENNNRINVVMLAPALGQVDFRTKEYNGTKITPFRTFSKQVKKIHITVNKDDKILKKYIKPLSSKMNPTDLGYDIQVFRLLKKSYPKMSMSNFNGINSHSFVDYINDKRFLEILKEIEVKTK